MRNRVGPHNNCGRLVFVKPKFAFWQVIIAGYGRGEDATWSRIVSLLHSLVSYSSEKLCIITGWVNVRLFSSLSKFNLHPIYSSGNPTSSHSNCFSIAFLAIFTSCLFPKHRQSSIHDSHTISPFSFYHLNKFVTGNNNVIKNGNNSDDTWTTCTRVKYPLFQVFSAKYIKIYSI